MLHERGNSLTVRWTPAHAGVEGNEQVNEAAKHAAREGEPALATAFYERPASPIFFEELPRPGPRPPAPGHGAMLSVATDIVLPPGGRVRRELAWIRIKLAGRFYQPLSGHAATAVHRRQMGQAPSNRC